jgi:hypothetical protein
MFGRRLSEMNDFDLVCGTPRNVPFDSLIPSMDADLVVIGLFQFSGPVSLNDMFFANPRRMSFMCL